ncbi:hypothetical protein AB1Y20_006766 [Prymnesium parvum]|uniref:RRM domain-containing protein n=1 Tax=Prymnesium parvum TaxID=97485 RepID=A0AB34IZD5_PRYPA
MIGSSQGRVGTEDSGFDAAEAAAGALAEAAAGSVLDTATEEAVVARLRGLPWSYGPQDVCDFLSNVGVTLQPEAVTMLHNAAGEAFVTLETSAQLTEVVKANRQQVGRRYVEVFASTAAEKQAACERNRATMRDDAGYRGVLRMRGLPFSATAEEVLDFFGRPPALQPCNVHLMRRSDGRASGDAYVVFDSEEAAVEALTFDKKKLGNRWVDLFQSSKGELYSLTSLGGIMQATTELASTDLGNGDPSTRALGEGHSVIKLRGLPWNVTSDDISTFLTGIQVPQGGVHLMNGSNGRPSGLAYVELSSEEDQAEAVKRDKQSIGGRYIDVFPCTQNELQARLAGGLERGMSHGNNPAADQLFTKLRGLPYAASDQQIAAFFAPLQVIAVQVAYNSQGQPSGFGFVQFRTADDAATALQRSNQVLGSRYVEVFRCTRAEMEQARMHAMAVLPKQWHHGPQMHGMAHIDPGYGGKGSGRGHGLRGHAPENAYSAYQAALQTLTSRPAAIYPPAGGPYAGHAASYASADPAYAASQNVAYGSNAAYGASYGNTEVAYSNGAVPGAVAGPGYGQDAAGYGQGGNGYTANYAQGAATGPYSAPATAGYATPGAAAGTAPNYTGQAAPASYGAAQGYNADYGYNNWYYAHPH